MIEMYRQDYYKILLTLSKTPDESSVLDNFTNALEEALGRGFPIDYCCPDGLDVSLLSSVILYFNNNWGRGQRFKNLTPDFVKILLNHNADVNIKDPQGWTPLMFATAMEADYSIDTLKVLLSQSAIDVNLSNEDGMTALDIICKDYIFCKNRFKEASQLEKIKLLIDAGGKLKQQLIGDKEKTKKLESFIAAYIEQKAQLNTDCYNYYDYDLLL